MPLFDNEEDAWEYHDNGLDEAGRRVYLVS